MLRFIYDIVFILTHSIICLTSGNIPIRRSTGIATQNEDLIAGLDIPTKALRVKEYQKNTMASFAELLGALGLESAEGLNRHKIMVRTGAKSVQSYEELYPTVKSGALLKGQGPERLQGFWDRAII